MVGMGCLDILYRKRKVEFSFSEIVFFCPVVQVRQFQLKIRLSVTKVDKGKIRLLDTLYLFKAQGFFVELHAFFQVKDVEIEVSKF